MKNAIIKYTNRYPSWNTIPTIPIQHFKGRNEAEIEAWAQICYDRDNLYLHMWAREEDIRAEVNDPLGMPCRDSCLEFFFRPDPKDMRYFNIELNPNGCLFLGFGSCIQDLIRMIPLEDRFQIKTARTSDGWEIFFLVPFAFIREFFPDFSASSEKEIRANFYKCGEFTEIPHDYSWSPYADRPHGFHCPELFGKLVFE